VLRQQCCLRQQSSPEQQPAPAAAAAVQQRSKMTGTNSSSSECSKTAAEAPHSGADVGSLVLSLGSDDPEEQIKALMELVKLAPTAADVSALVKAYPAVLSSMIQLLSTDHLQGTALIVLSYLAQNSAADSAAIVALPGALSLIGDCLRGGCTYTNQQEATRRLNHIARSSPANSTAVAAEPVVVSGLFGVMTSNKYAPSLDAATKLWAIAWSSKDSCSYLLSADPSFLQLATFLEATDSQRDPHTEAVLSIIRHLVEESQEASMCFFARRPKTVIRLVELMTSSDDSVRSAAAGALHALIDAHPWRPCEESPDSVPGMMELLEAIMKSFGYSAEVHSVVASTLAKVTRQLTTAAELVSMDM
jgi:hypothetical protein